MSPLPRKGGIVMVASNNSATSEKQVAANRENAKKSTGPKTEAGKAASRMNAVRHGLCSTVALLPGDDEKELDDLERAIYASLKPRDQTEAVLVDQYVSVAWKLRWVAITEAEVSVLVGDGVVDGHELLARE